VGIYIVHRNLHFEAVVIEKFINCITLYYRGTIRYIKKYYLYKYCRDHCSISSRLSYMVILFMDHVTFRMWYSTTTTNVVDITSY
jgi:hypothetical protein